MVGRSHRLISGFDGLICAVLSIVLHFLGLRSIPWERSVDREQPSPIAIEWMILAETTSPQTDPPQTKIPSTLSALRGIPLQTQDSRTLPPSAPERSIVPNTAPTRVSPPRTIPLPSPINPLPRSAPEGSQLQVPLAEPLITLPSPTSLSTPEPVEKEALENIEPTEPLPYSPPVVTPLPSQSPSPVTIEEEVSVAVNPSPLKFRVLVEAQSTAEPAASSGDYTPPQPLHQALILTADPLTRSCSVPTLAAIQDSGKALLVTVAIDAEGKVSGATPKLTGSALSADYQSWATCLLQDWPFQPAQREAVPVAESLDVLVTIEILSSP
ncbi:MAG: hypothetical protein ACO3EZ_06110 [Prochlorotrichaceae cyanobacterium]